MSDFINTVDILGDDTMCDSIITKTLTEYADSYIKSIGDYALYSCTKLKSVDFPNVTSVGSFAFNGCSALTTVNLPLVEEMGTYAFYSNRALESIHIPLVRELGKSTFYGCTKLTSIDLTAVISIDTKAFYNCSSLEVVILRSETACELLDTNIFDGTPIIDGTGYIYVPSALVETYRSGTNWSAIADSIRTIEDYADITGG